MDYFDSLGLGLGSLPRLSRAKAALSVLKILPGKREKEVWRLRGRVPSVLGS